MHVNNICMFLQHGHQDYPHSSHMPPTVDHQTPTDM